MRAKQLTGFVQERFRQLADPETAVAMAAYMKTDMPFYGIQKPLRVPVYREMKKRFEPETRQEHQKGIRSLWNRPHREEKYAALQYARGFKRFITIESLPLYEQLIREGAWWDLVDEVAVHLVGVVLLTNRRRTRSVIDDWTDDEDMWIRRAAMLSQIGHKERADPKQLFDHALRLSTEKEFFIRKAIGWALRDYSYTAPEAVRDFLLANRDRLSGLSFREGGKQLVRAGWMER